MKIKKKLQTLNSRYLLRPILIKFYTIISFEDTKRVIRICKSEKNRQHNGQKKKCKKTNNDLQKLHIKLKIK